MAKVGTAKRNLRDIVELETIAHPKVGDCGGREYVITDPIQKLISTCGTMFNEPTYYEDLENHDDEYDLNNSSIEIINTMKNCLDKNPEDFFIIMSWCRDALKMRTTPEIGFAIASQHKEGKKYLSKYEENIIQRADQIRTIFGAVRHLFHKNNSNHKGSINKPLAKALAKSFNRFNEYMFLKYDNSSPYFKDVLAMICQKLDGKPILPKPIYHYLTTGEVLDPEQTPIFAARKKFNKSSTIDEMIEIANEADVTAAVFLSKAGSLDGNKRENLLKAWEWLIINEKIGYMDLRMRLRSLEKLNPSESIKNEVFKIIANTPSEKHKQLPFRFLAARRIVTDKVFKLALDKALDNAVVNLPEFTGKSLVLVDLSGSMNSPISGKSKTTIKEVACILSSILAKTQGIKTKIVGFGDTFREIEFNELDSISTIFDKIFSTHVGNCTIPAPALENEISLNNQYDRIIILSDLCCYTMDQEYCRSSSLPESIEKYTRLFPNTFYYSINLSKDSHGSQMNPENKKVCLLSGFSESIFNMFINFEEGNKDKNKTLPTIEILREKYQIN